MTIPMTQIRTTLPMSMMTMATMPISTMIMVLIQTLMMTMVVPGIPMTIIATFPPRAIATPMMTMAETAVVEGMIIVVAARAVEAAMTMAETVTATDPATRYL